MSHISGVQVNAVDSEFTGVQQDDQCRMIAAMADMVKPQHPLRTFMWGNKESLWKQPLMQNINIRERIVQHYNEQYSASRMRLVLLSGHKLDVLQQWVEQLFDEVRLLPLSGFLALGYFQASQNLHVNVSAT
jgi:secreted Zn-dependent insulinase-like peptidase